MERRQSGYRAVKETDMIQTALIAAAVIILIVLAACIGIRYLSEHRHIYKNSKIRLDIGNAQIIGNREKQDDSFGTSLRPYAAFAIVADGIGGYQDGKLASEIAVATYIDEFGKRDITENITYFFQKSAVMANGHIRDEFGEIKGGTTQVSIVIVEDRMYWSSVGDSNIAVLRNGRLIEVNRKENVKNWLEDQYYAGIIGREEAMGSATDKRLVNYLGFDGFKKACESDRPIYLKKHDKVLLYSDGVELLGQIELENILAKRCGAQKQADLIMEALERNPARNKDNATIIILTVM